ncbi:hypothetical protein HAZT_HAZT005974 [Hyalella azteca]|nr:hypothetical protein HAZT_HAZT005974 [Hyalella azteca]
MSKGKIASQCSHASVMAYKRMRSPLQSVRYGSGLLTSWDLNGQAKVVLRAENLQVMKKLEQMAREKNIPVHKVHDAGRTEIPEGSLTVMGLGPAPIFLIDQVTGHLRLL